MSVASLRSSRLRIFVFLIFLMLGVISPTFSYSQPDPIPQGTLCAECGMKVDPNSKFSTEAITTAGKKLFFCDIGDMLRHFRSDRGKLKTVYVKDYVDGGWIDGEKASYILDKRFSTPMSWSIAAFRNESEAKRWGKPVDFDGALRLLK